MENEARAIASNSEELVSLIEELRADNEQLTSNFEALRLLNVALTNENHELRVNLETSQKVQSSIEAELLSTNQKLAHVLSMPVDAATTAPTQSFDGISYPPKMENDGFEPDTFQSSSTATIKALRHSLALLSAEAGARTESLEAEIDRMCSRLEETEADAREAREKGTSGLLAAEERISTLEQTIRDLTSQVQAAEAARRAAESDAAGEAALRRRAESARDEVEESLVRLRRQVEDTSVRYAEDVKSLSSQLESVRNELVETRRSAAEAAARSTSAEMENEARLLRTQQESDLRASASTSRLEAELDKALTLAKSSERTNRRLEEEVQMLRVEGRKMALELDEERRTADKLRHEVEGLKTELVKAREDVQEARHKREAQETHLMAHIKKLEHANKCWVDHEKAMKRRISKYRNAYKFVKGSLAKAEGETLAFTEALLEQK